MPITTPMVLGNVTLYTDGLADGDYWVKIDYEFDNNSALAFEDETLDPIIGAAGIVITPEPGTLMLLAFAFYGVKWRR